MKRLWNRMRGFRDDRQGAISIEFGILATVLIGILFGAVDFSRYILTQHKTDKAVAAVGDMITQYAVINTDNVKDIFKAAAAILTHFEVKDRGMLIVSHIHAATKDNPRITWQEKSSLTMKKVSKLGTVGSKPKLPAHFKMDAGETVVAVESYVKFEPMLFDLAVSKQDIYKIAYYHPRRSDQVAYNDTGSAAVDDKDCGNDPGKSQGIGYLMCNKNKNKK